jgi:hypothetical protein
VIVADEDDAGSPVCTDSPLEQAGFAQACNINGIHWQTGLSAEIDTKGVSGAVANLQGW